MAASSKKADDKVIRPSRQNRLAGQAVGQQLVLPTPKSRSNTYAVVEQQQQLRLLLELAVTAAAAAATGKAGKDEND